jgi:hypothetical protein
VATDIAAIDAMRYDEQRERQMAIFKRIRDRRGWNEKLPPLGVGEVSPQSYVDRKIVYFRLTDERDAQSLKTAWEWDGARWRLAGMTFPRD